MQIIYLFLFAANAVVGFSATNGSVDPFECKYTKLPSALELSIELEKGHLEERVVEIAIVCDKEVSDSFQQNRDKAIDYFEALFWDVGTRFQELRYSKITFRVTSVTLIQATEEQPFIERAKVEGGKVELETCLGTFGTWMYEKLNSLPKFDIAMAAVSSSHDGTFGISNIGSICAIDHEKRKVDTVFVFAPSKTNNPAMVVVHEIAHILGAQHDDEQNNGREKIVASLLSRNVARFDGLEDVISSCNTSVSTFVMAEKADRSCNGFFSPCTDFFIAGGIYSKCANCLRRIDSNKPPIIDFSSFRPVEQVIFGGLSMYEQCRPINNSFALARMDEIDKQCTASASCINVKDDYTFGFMDLHPFDGTPCSKNGRCYNGKCLQAGVQLINVASEQCLQTGNILTPALIPRVGKCPNFITPLNSLVIRDFGDFGKYIMIPFSSPNGIESDKCLTLNTMNRFGFDYLSFGECSNEPQEKLGWDINIVGNGEFLITHHIHKNICLGLYNQNNKVIARTNCSTNDTSVRWRLVMENRITITNLDNITHKMVPMPEESWTVSACRVIVETNITPQLEDEFQKFVLETIFQQEYISDFAERFCSRKNESESGTNLTDSVPGSSSANIITFQLSHFLACFLYLCIPHVLFL